jgi:hypothetical protein
MLRGLPGRKRHELSPVAARFPEANLGSVCRPSGRTVGTGAAVAPAVSGRLPRGASISPRHPGREARPPSRRLRTPRGSDPPARRRPAARPLEPEGPGGSSTGDCRPFSGPRTGKPGHPNLLSGGPKPSGGRLRSARDPPLFGTGGPAPGDGSESDSLHLRRNRGVHSAPACDRRIPPASASGRIRKLRRLLRTCAGSAPFLGAW